MIEYVYLNSSDVDRVRVFYDKVKLHRAVVDWMLKSLESGSDDFMIIGEIIDGSINGILAGCTLEFWFKSPSKLLPIWLGIRMDRLQNSPASFKRFISETTRLITIYFEQKNYFHHYIIRKLPKKDMPLDKLQDYVNKSWAFYPYHAIVEMVIKTQHDFDNSPGLFKQMVGQFIEPLVVLSVNIDNSSRIDRSVRYNII